VTQLSPDVFDPRLDLKLERVIDVPPELVWKAWTEPEHLMKWFTPSPWKTVACEIDLRPGGRFHAVMESPEGVRHDEGAGCYLEVVPHKKLVWTDALGPGYRPRNGGFMTAVLVLEPSGSGTRYIACALHKDEADRKKHEDMGFYQGWGAALDQLVALAKTMR
jgi:uncharacterized protein YndB with AHSA1/START domain